MDKNRMLKNFSELVARLHAHADWTEDDDDRKAFIEAADALDTLCRMRDDARHERDDARAESQEQGRMNGMGGEREKALYAELNRTSALLERARTILDNMAQSPGSVFDRWSVHHEPLRADAKNLVPLIDEELAGDKPI
jgi:hypothetical protein